MELRQVAAGLLKAASSSDLPKARKRMMLALLPTAGAAVALAMTDEILQAPVWLVLPVTYLVCYSAADRRG